jgi:1-phosphatidylinositol-4-phosphate 5-kinase
MKGSAYDREVLAKKMYVDASKVTLKDLDFFKTEQTL